jgi:hypothetical protein
LNKQVGHASSGPDIQEAFKAKLQYFESDYWRIGRFGDLAVDAMDDRFRGFTTAVWFP